MYPQPWLIYFHCNIPIGIWSTLNRWGSWIKGGNIIWWSLLYDGTMEFDNVRWLSCNRRGIVAYTSGKLGTHITIGDHFCRRAQSAKRGCSVCPPVTAAGADDLYCSCRPCDINTVCGVAVNCAVYNKACSFTTPAPSSHLGGIMCSFLSSTTAGIMAHMHTIKHRTRRPPRAGLDVLLLLNLDFYKVQRFEPRMKSFDTVAVEQTVKWRVAMDLHDSTWRNVTP